MVCGAKYARPNDGVSVEEQDGDPNSLLNYHRRVYALRKSNPALFCGRYVPMRTDPQGRLWGFWPYTKEQVMSVIVNFGQSKATLYIDRDCAPCRLAECPRGAWTGKRMTFDGDAVTV